MVHAHSVWHADRWLEPLLHVMAIGTALLLALIIAFLFLESWPALAHGHWQRFFAPGWFPGSGEYNLWPMLVATVLATVGALVLAVPLGIAGAVFAQYVAPAWLARPWRALAALLAGIPSVVYGLWGLTTLVPLIAVWAPPGASLLAATLILAMMILPTVLLTADAALAAVPAHTLQGASALGLSLTATVVRVALPAARRGIAGGILLAAVRAAGETMAVLMVAGNVVQIPASVFDPIRVLTANMALEMAYATDHHRAALFVSGVLLTAVIAILVRLGRALEIDRHEPRSGS